MIESRVSSLGFVRKESSTTKEETSTTTLQKDTWGRYGEGARALAYILSVELWKSLGLECGVSKDVKRVELGSALPAAQCEGLLNQQ